jgi:hypothetical protein
VGADIASAGADGAGGGSWLGAGLEMLLLVLLVLCQILSALRPCLKVPPLRLLLLLLLLLLAGLAAVAAGAVASLSGRPRLGNSW